MTVYSTKDIAKLLEINESTVRKYCDLLEKAGYSFHKNEYGHRGFFNGDIIVFKKLIEYKSTMALDKASNAVVSWKKGVDIAGDNTDNDRYVTRYSDLLHEFENFKEQQNEFNQKILVRMDQRDQNLINVLRQTLESKKEIASTNQKKWWKFWK